MASHAVTHRGLTYHVVPCVDYDGRTVLEIEVEYATWGVDWLSVMEDLHDIGEEAIRAFWPQREHAPQVEKPAPLDLATYLLSWHEDEIRAALEREIVDTAIAVEGAAR